jgi:hypothetical protein
MSIAALVATILGGLWIDYGWQPLAGGGNEYIIQVPPELIDTLHRDGIESYVPPGVENIRRIRITVGREKLPQTVARESQRPGSPAAEEPSKATMPATSDAEKRVAKYPEEPKSAVVNGDDKSLTTGANADAAGDLFGFDAFTLAAIGLGIACALVVFLVWANLSMRARYRALLLDRRYELKDAC